MQRCCSEAFIEACIDKLACCNAYIYGKDKDLMEFIKFIFVLLIVVPVAVLMIYIINRLNGEVKTSVKKAADEKKRTDTVPEREAFGRKYKYTGNVRPADRHAGKPSGNDYPGADRPERKTAAVKQSNRKRRKERKNKRKVREKQI